MALVSKTAGKRRVSEGVPGTHQKSNVVEAAHCQISVRAGPKPRPKMASERITVKAGESLKLLGGDNPLKMSIEELARKLNRSGTSCGKGSVLTKSVERQQGLCNSQDDLIRFQCLQVSIQIVECRTKRSHQTLIPQNRTAHKRQAPGLLSQRISNEAGSM